MLLVCTGNGTKNRSDNRNLSILKFSITLSRLDVPEIPDIDLLPEKAAGMVDMKLSSAIKLLLP